MKKKTKISGGAYFKVVGDERSKFEFLTSAVNGAVPMTFSF